MKAKHALVAMIALLPWTAGAADERLTEADLPPAVRQTLRESQHAGPVKHVSRATSNGRTVFVIEIEKNNALNPQLRIAEDGTLLREPMVPYVSTSDVPIVVPGALDAGAAVRRQQWSELPAAVRETAQREAHGRDVVDIDRETWNGRTVYEIEFRESGPNARVHVAEDGTLVRDEQSRLRSFFFGLQLADTPPAVQETVRRLAGDREVVDIDNKGTPDAPVYRVEIRGPLGTQELRVGADGKVIFNSREEPPRRG